MSGPENNPRDDELVDKEEYEKYERATLSRQVERTDKHIYCHGCTVAGGAERAIYHLPPACKA